MPYLGISPTRTDNRKIDTPLQRVGGGVGFNGSATQFYLTIEGEPVYPDTELLVQAILDGSQLNPKVDYFIQSNIITFTNAPQTGLTFFALVGDRVSLNKPGSDTVTTNTIKDGAVTTNKIANNSITSDKIAPGTVIESDVADGAITTIKLDGTAGTEAVTTAKIRDLNVTTAKIADLNITTGKIADLNVTTGKIADLNITTGKIADLNVSTGKLADLAVTTGKIADLNVSTGKLADLAVTSGKLGNDSVTSAKIANGAVGNTELSTGAVTSDKLNITVSSDPSTPVDGQLIWNTFSNTAKVYNTTAARWDELLTTTTSGALISWESISAVPSSISALQEKSTSLSDEEVVNGYAFNQSISSPKHVVVSTNGKISYSTNLTNWVYSVSGNTEDIKTISWGETFFFAGADANTLITSSDGVTWTPSTGPFGGSGASIVASHYANGIYLIGSSFGEIATSTGSTTFTLRNSNISSPVNSFVYNNGVFVAGGSSGDITTSQDVNVWTQRLNLGGLRKVFVESYGTGFIAVIDDLTSNDVSIRVSTNGIVWNTYASNPSNINTVKTFKYSAATQAYIIVNNEGYSYRSVDGKNWSLFNAPSFDVGTSIESLFVDFVGVSGVDYYVIGGTKTVSSTLTPYFAVATFNNAITQLQSNKNYIVDTSYGAISLDLPSNPSIGDIVRLADGANTWSDTPSTVSSGAKTFLVSTGAMDNSLILDFSGVNIDIVWTGTYWRVY
jgi:hypothetical protein